MKFLTNKIFNSFFSIGADVESGSHIRRLIISWNKTRSEDQGINNQQLSYGNESEKILETIFGNKDQIRHLESESSSEQIQKIKVEREDFYEQDVESRNSMPEENEFNHELLDHSTVSFF